MVWEFSTFLLGKSDVIVRDPFAATFKDLSFSFNARSFPGICVFVNKQF